MKKIVILLLGVAITLVIIGYNGTINFMKAFQMNPTNCSSLKDIEKKNCVTNYFSRVILIVIYNHPHYDSIPLLQAFYGPVFSTILFCGPALGNQSRDANVTFVDINRGIFGYECLGKAIRNNHDYDGYFYINDDVILNYWNLPDTEFDLNNIWESNNQFGKVDLAEPKPTGWYWWISPYGFNNGREAVDEIQILSKRFKVYRDLYDTYLQNGNQSRYLHNGRSDVVYIPRRHSIKFQELSRIFYQHKVFLEIAIPTMLRFLVPSSDIGTLNGHYLPGDVRKGDPRVTDSRYFWTTYLNKPNIWFIHPFKLHHLTDKNSELNVALMKHILIEKTKSLTNCVRV